MQWIKKGLVFNTTQTYEWSQTHAQVPVVDKISDKVWRIYYSTRNSKGKSTISYIEVEAHNPKNILYVHPLPILERGAVGTFDDSGIMPTCILNKGKQKLLYYIGWMLRGTVPYHNSIGLAISNDGEQEFRKVFEGPIIGMSAQEPYFTGTCYVLPIAGEYRAYYLSCVGWKEIEGKLEPFYNIKIAKSKDGLHWLTTGQVAIDLEEGEGGIASASVVYINNKFRMWFSVRGAVNYRTNQAASYRIGYAESIDGYSWTRLDQHAGIDIAQEGWDSQMIAYPYVFADGQKLYMFYNGNGFGQSGFGYAELKM